MTGDRLPFPASASRPDPGLGEPGADRPEPARALEGFAAGACPPDSAFDQFLGEPIRRLSAQHWTPLAVVSRAAQWLDDCNVRTVLDIGSGVGKFCVAAAIASRCHFTGLEHRASLVGRARMLARAFGVADRTYFIHGALGQARLPGVDAYYLYNPFEENLVTPAQRIDGSVQLSRERHARDIESLQALLVRAPAGTYVLVYNGFGASLPPNFSRMRVARDLPNELCLWRKAASRLIRLSSPRSSLTASGGGE